MTAITPALVKEHGLSEDEYACCILKLMGREPSFVELGIFSVMWSRALLVQIDAACICASCRPRRRGCCRGTGENAGVIDIGDLADAAIFKMESHNHPSFIEPYQGAATGTWLLHPCGDVVHDGARGPLL